MFGLLKCADLYLLLFSLEKATGSQVEVGLDAEPGVTGEIACAIYEYIGSCAKNSAMCVEKPQCEMSSPSALAAGAVEAIKSTGEVDFTRRGGGGSELPELVAAAVNTEFKHVPRTAQNTVHAYPCTSAV